MGFGEEGAVALAICPSGDAKRIGDGLTRAEQRGNRDGTGEATPLESEGGLREQRGVGDLHKGDACMVERPAGLLGPGRVGGGIQCVGHGAAPRAWQQRGQVWLPAMVTNCHIKERDLSHSWYSVADMKRRASISTALLLACGFASCGELPDARDAWVCNALAEDNEVMLGRNAARVEAKLKVMTEEPYLWFRGTAGLFFREVVLPANGWVFAGGKAAEASDVQLVGDAHIENIGTYLDEGGLLRAEFNDFDAASFGSFWLEVWRLASSFAVLDKPGLEAGSPETGGPGPLGRRRICRCRARRDCCGWASARRQR